MHIVSCGLCGCSVGAACLLRDCCVSCCVVAAWLLRGLLRVLLSEVIRVYCMAA